MSRNLCTIVFIAVVSMTVHAATITSTASGSLSAGATWVGGVAPNCTSDNIVIAATHAVTVDINCTIGTAASAAGLGLSVANSASASLIVPNGITLTMRGFDQSANAIANVQANGSLICQTGGTILLDVASDWQSQVIVNGNLTTNGCHWSIPAANINWANNSTANTYSGVVANPYDLNNSIYVIKLFTGGTNPVLLTNSMTPGPVANAGGTALGSIADSSISFGAGGFSGTTHNEVASYAAISSLGDYFVDYNLGVIWYKGGTTLTATISFKYATWFSSGIQVAGNTTGSAVIFDGNTVDHLGSNNGSAVNSAEFAGSTLEVLDKFSPVINSGRGVEIKNNTFTHCARPIALYPNRLGGVGGTTTNHIFVTGNTFNYIQYMLFGAGTAGNLNGTHFTEGAIQIGYTSFVDFTGSTFNMFAPLFNSGITRGTNVSDNVSTNTGRLTTDGLFPGGCTSCLFDSNTITGFSSTVDTATFSQGGGAGTPNTYTNNVIGYGKRASRMTNNMVVNHNIFYRNYHHAVVQASGGGYIANYTFSNNVIYDDLNAGDFPGGFSFGYNASMWLDNIIVQHNTFDRGTRCIEFQDMEATIVLSTRISVLDNICSNGIHGIYRPPDDATPNVSKLAIARNDFNDDYNQTGAGSTATNVQQATFTKGGVEYNASTRNIAGVFIFNPCVALGVPICAGGYTLPDATSRSLVLTVAGTEGTTKSFKLAWSGGAQVEYVIDQGTSSGAGTTSTLVDATKTFGNSLLGQQVYIFSGTGAGQFGMIKAPISTPFHTLPIVANTANFLWAIAPDATSVYVILNSDQKLFDSGAVAFVEAGIHSPTLTQANGTYTDAAITMSTNQFNANPSYVSNPTALGPSADLHPKNATLLNAGSDGVTIGAFPTLGASTGASCGSSFILLGVGCQ